MSNYLRDAATRYQVYLERVKAGSVKQTERVLQDIDRAVRRALQALGTGPLNNVDRRRFERLLVDLTLAMDKPLSRQRTELMATLRELNSYTSEFEQRLLDSATTAAVRPLSASAAAAWAVALDTPIQATGALLEPFIKSWSDSTKVAVTNTLRNGFAQGKTTDQVIREIRGTKSANYRDGLIGGQLRRQTAAMVRTSMQHSAQSGRQAVWAANDDIVEGYRWVSTLDGRTTSQCRSLDGQEFEVGSGPQPPLHIGCRSTTIAIIEGVNLLDNVTRASKGAEGGQQVRGATTYYEWLRRQPAWFQDDAIGPVRGKLFRDGGLSAAEFARLNLDKNFMPLTLEEMRRKAPRAFELAGIDDGDI